MKIAEVPPGPPVLQTIVAEVYGPEPAERLAAARRVREIFERNDDMEARGAEAGAPASSGEAAGPALFDRILAEAQRTFASTLYGHGLDAVFLTGPGSRLPGACEFFEKSFETQAVHLDFEPALAGLEDAAVAEQDRTHGAVALGLALRAANAKAVGLDFRKDEFRYEKRFAKLKAPLLVGGVLLFLGLLLNCVYLRRDQTRHEENLKNVRQLLAWPQEAATHSPARQTSPSAAQS